MINAVLSNLSLILSIMMFSVGFVVLIEGKLVGKPCRRWVAVIFFAGWILVFLAEHHYFCGRCSILLTPRQRRVGVNYVRSRFQIKKDLESRGGFFIPSNR